MTPSLFARWDSWLLRSGPPHVLAIFRIAFAAFLLVEAATYLPHVTMMFSSEGFAISMHIGLVALAPPVPVVAWLLALGYVAALLCLMVGYRTRTALVALILYFLYYWQLSFYAFPSSYHRLFFFSFLVLLLGGSDKTFSLRMLRERGSWSAWEPVSVLPQRLLAIQLTATYAIVGWQKWWLPLWQGGRRPLLLVHRPMGDPVGQEARGGRTVAVVLRRAHLGHEGVRDAVTFRPLDSAGPVVLFLRCVRVPCPYFHTPRDLVVYGPSSGLYRVFRAGGGACVPQETVLYRLIFRFIKSCQLQYNRGTQRYARL
jgi:uncharacterized membrane protein YphA (DoxX/SURF4 family)